MLRSKNWRKIRRFSMGGNRSSDIGRNQVNLGKIVSQPAIYKNTYNKNICIKFSKKLIIRK